MLSHDAHYRLLAKAVEREDVISLEGLLALGVPVDGHRAGEFTPLMKACSLGYSEIVELLLSHASDPNLEVNETTPLLICASHPLVRDRCTCISLLLLHGGNVNASNKDGKTPLMLAASKGYKEAVKELLAAPDIDVNLKDHKGWNALFYAARGNIDTEVVYFLLQAGIDPTLKDVYKRTAMDWESIIHPSNPWSLREILECMGYLPHGPRFRIPAGEGCPDVLPDLLPGMPPDGEETDKNNGPKDNSGFLSSFKRLAIKTLNMGLPFITSLVRRP